MQIEIIIHRQTLTKIRKQDTALSHLLHRYALMTWGMLAVPRCVLFSCSDLYMTNDQMFMVPILLRYLQSNWNTHKRLCAWRGTIQYINGLSQVFGTLQVPTKYNALITTATEDLCLN